MRIAFFNPKGSAKRGHIVPPNLVGLAHECHKLGVKVAIFDGNGYQDHQAAIAAVKGFRPNTLCVSTYFDKSHRSIESEKAMIAAMRHRVEKVIIGGHHVSAAPNDVIALHKPDIAVLHEGEIALAETIRTRYNFDQTDHRAIAVEQQGLTTIVSPKQAYNLDNLPLPTELPPIFPLQALWDSFIINVARGCIGQCNFCGGAKIPLHYMSPARVIEHINAWLSIEAKYIKQQESCPDLEAAQMNYIQRFIDLLAPDLTSNPVLAAQIVATINQNFGWTGNHYSFSARMETFNASRLAKLEQKWQSYNPANQWLGSKSFTMASGLEAPAQWGAFHEWWSFLYWNTVYLETAPETFVEHRLGADHLNKTRDHGSHKTNFHNLLKFTAATSNPRNKTRVTTDLILADPETTLAEIESDFQHLLEFAQEFEHLIIYPDVFGNSLQLFPGNATLERFGNGTLTINPCQDQRVGLLLMVLRHNRGAIGINRKTPLETALKRILALIEILKSDELEKFSFKEGADPNQPNPALIEFFATKYAEIRAIS